ncbi:hypothetical protein L4C37_07090 [Vibrio kagoshimensis]|uniref:hypothetical protein n=1 Tax=Vibrio kagoshimensis TaxID=2910244 RepID=UPI002355D5ED
MQYTQQWKKSALALLLTPLLITSAFADENKGEEVQEKEQVESKLGGSVSLAYDTNIYNKDDYRAVRNISWGGSLSYRFNQDYRAYLSSGGYRALENETGTFANDTVIGLSRSGLFTFGETGSIGMSGQFTIPTSETSKNDELNTAFRLAIPVSFKALGIDFSIAPRLRKNFHEYKTAGGKSLTEWTYSLSTGASYKFEKLVIGISALGGNSQSYQGTRRDSFNYGGSIYGSYQATDSIGISLTGATSGFYADAEQGTLGNIDLFDADRASYIAEITYSF